MYIAVDNVEFKIVRAAPDRERAIAWARASCRGDFRIQTSNGKDWSVYSPSQLRRLLASVGVEVPLTPTYNDLINLAKNAIPDHWADQTPLKDIPPPLEYDDMAAKKKAPAKKKAAAKKVPAKKAAPAKKKAAVKTAPVKLPAKKAKAKATANIAGGRATAASAATPAGKIVQNGITRPKAKTQSGKLWAFADQISRETQAPARRVDVCNFAAKNGMSASLAITAHKNWRVFYGLPADE